MPAKTGTKDIPGKYIGERKTEAAERGLCWEVSNEYLQQIWDHQNGKCPLSGVNIWIGYNGRIKTREVTASLDRIDSSKGYVDGNVQWVHKIVNSMKWDTPENVFIETCKTIRDFNT